MSDKLPDEVEKALRNCDIYGDDAYGVQTPRASIRLSIAKAIRDAEERMRERAAKVCDAEADQSRRDGYLDQMDTELRLSKKIRSLPLEAGK